MFADWLSAFYQNKEHSALGEGISPKIAFQRDSAALRFVDPGRLSEAFLHHAVRKVDKSGCLSLDGKKYDAGWAALGKTVQVTYDPKERSEISVSWNNNTWSARELQIGERCAPKPKAPETALPIAVKESRVLKTAARKRQAETAAQKHAISFSAMED
jgi:hypothetical protein